jgi:hypothetical protein
MSLIGFGIRMCTGRTWLGRGRFRPRWGGCGRWRLRRRGPLELRGAVAGRCRLSSCLRCDFPCLRELRRRGVRADIKLASLSHSRKVGADANHASGSLSRCRHRELVRKENPKGLVDVGSHPLCTVGLLNSHYGRRFAVHTSKHLIGSSIDFQIPGLNA